MLLRRGGTCGRSRGITPLSSLGWRREQGTGREEGKTRFVFSHLTSASADADLNKHRRRVNKRTNGAYASPASAPVSSSVIHTWSY